MNTDLFSNLIVASEAVILAPPVTRNGASHDTSTPRNKSHSRMMSADVTMSRVVATTSRQRNILSAIRRISLSTPIGQAPSASRPTPTESPKPTSFIAADTVAQTLHGYDRNNLFLFLKSKFGPDDAERMMREYCIGTSKHWPGACVFWQTDINGRVRTGKVMLYDAESGKRVKDPFNHVSWAHSLMKLPDYNLRQCFFGEHLLPMNRGKPVALVESEKTALIASLVSARISMARHRRQERLPQCRGSPGSPWTAGYPLSRFGGNRAVAAETAIDEVARYRGHHIQIHG